MSITNWKLLNTLMPVLAANQNDTVNAKWPALKPTNQNSLYEGDMIGNFDNEPLAAPVVETESETTKPKSKWQKFSETLDKYAPLILGLGGLTNPLFGNAALTAYKQIEDEQAQKELAAQRYQEALALQEQQLNETKTKNAWERYKDQVEMNREKDLDRQNQQYKDQSLSQAKELAELNADTDIKIAGIRASDISGPSATQQKLEQQKSATVVASMAGKYKRREDFLADMKRHRETLVQKMGQENYDKLYQAAEMSTNIWPEGGAGVNFVPGQGSPIRALLHGSTSKKPLIAGGTNTGNAPVKTKQVRNKSTGDVMTAYVGVKDGQLYTTEDEARLH